MTKFTPDTEGIFLNVPMATYRSAPGENFSKLKHIHESPKKYLWNLQNPMEQTADMIFGSVVHALILEKHAVESLVVLRPSEFDSWRTKESRKWRDQQSALVVTEAEIALMKAASDALQADPKCAWILQRAQKEVACFRRHERTGLLLKGRLDLPFNDLNNLTAVCDIKKVQSVKRDDMSRTIGQRLYHVQLALYIDLIGATGGCYIAAVESDEPHETRLFKLKDASIERGRIIYETWLDKLTWCLKNDRWPGLDEDSEEVCEIEEPIWVQRQELPY